MTATKTETGVSDAEVIMHFHFIGGSSGARAIDDIPALKGAFHHAAMDMGNFTGVEIRAQRDVPEGQENEDFGPLYDQHDVTINAREHHAHMDSPGKQGGCVMLSRERSKTFLDAIGFELL